MLAHVYEFCLNLFSEYSRNLLNFMKKFCVNHQLAGRTFIHNALRYKPVLHDCKAEHAQSRRRFSKQLERAIGSRTLQTSLRIHRALQMNHKTSS